MKLLFVANVDWYVISHRYKILESAVNFGWQVTVACEDTGRRSELEALGIRFIDFKFERSGTNPLKEIVLLRRFYRLYRKEKFDVLHHVSLKPVIYGSVIAKLLKKPAVLNAVSGLGYAFTKKDKKMGFTQKSMLYLMRFGFNKKNLAFIFQNNDDYEQLSDLGVIHDYNLVYFIKGSGVDLDEYKPMSKEVEGDKVDILFPARMLYDKGIVELQGAAEMLRKDYESKVLFTLAGKADPDNKAGVSEEYLNNWQDGSYVKWIGFSENMIETLRNSDIAVLPSYREGLPKSLIEAAAMGKPIVTTNAIGCKECVDEGINGYLVDVKSETQLADALKKLIVDANLREKMGKASRLKAEKEFDVKIVIKKHLEIYDELLKLG